MTTIAVMMISFSSFLFLLRNEILNIITYPHENQYHVKRGACSELYSSGGNPALQFVIERQDSVADDIVSQVLSSMKTI